MSDCKLKSMNSDLSYLQCIVQLNNVVLDSWNFIHVLCELIRAIIAFFDHYFPVFKLKEKYHDTITLYFVNYVMNRKRDGFFR